MENFNGETFVAYVDISGFKELMKNKSKAKEALDTFYQAGFDILREEQSIDGLFVSDCGVIFVRSGNDNLSKLNDLLVVIKKINRKMICADFMLTTSIAYGDFNYNGKLELENVRKNQILGPAYLNAFLDNEIGKPKIQPGDCRIIKSTIPKNIDISTIDLIKQKPGDNSHLYYYWNLSRPEEIQDFENKIKDAYSLKYEGIKKALKHFIS